MKIKYGVLCLAFDTCGVETVPATLRCVPVPRPLSTGGGGPGE